MKCKICGKELKKKGRKIYCSKKCRDRNDYLRNKEQYKENAREWERKNPERARLLNKKSMKRYRLNNREKFNKAVLNNYYKNKDKWKSRQNIYRVINETKKKTDIIRKCKKCGSENNIRLKNEVYPKSPEEIRKAIREGKIYYLCSDCRWGI